MPDSATDTNIVYYTSQVNTQKSRENTDDFECFDNEIFMGCARGRNMKSIIKNPFQHFKNTAENA